MSDFTFPKSARLRTRSHFIRMGRHTQRFVGAFLVVEVKPNHNGATRLGLTVTKRFGKAHERNRFKRIVREAFRLERGELRGEMDILVKPKPEAKQATAHDVRKELLAFLAKSLF